MNMPTVNMDNFNIDEELENAFNQRFAMPPIAIAAFRQAALKGAVKLMQMVESEAFDKMPTKDKIDILNLIFDRAYGKSETASNSAITAMKTGQGQNNSDHGKQLTAISERMAKRQRALPELAAKAVTTAADTAHDFDVAHRQARVERLQAMEHRNSPVTPLKAVK